MRIFALISIILCLNTVVYAEQDTRSLTSVVTSKQEALSSIFLGEYNVYGFNTDGKPYRGKAIINLLPNKPWAYEIKWIIGESIHTGIAEIHEKKQIFLVSTWRIEGHSQTNTVYYQIRKDGVLLGVFSQNGREVLVPQPKI